MEKASQIMSGLLQKMNRAPQSIPSDPVPDRCFYCHQSFPARIVGEKWAEVCLECKRQYHHRMLNFPSRYQGIRLSQCRETAGNRLALEFAKAWARYEGQGNLWFYGAPGTGKTYIASAAAADGPIGTVTFVSVPEMLLKFQASVNDHEEMDLIKTLSGPESRVRLFDDVGAHRVSDFAIEMFGLLLERFYANDQTGLIFTSNLSPKEILDLMGERISSRMMGLARPVRLEGIDWRLEKGENT